jgi:hypothetical protein
MDRLHGDVRSQRVYMGAILASPDYSLTTLNDLTDAKLIIHSGETILLNKTIILDLFFDIFHFFIGEIIY